MDSNPGNLFLLILGSSFKFFCYFSIWFIHIIGYSQKWEWIPCVYDFRQIAEDGSISFLNFSPSVALTDPKRDVLKKKLTASDTDFKGRESKVEIAIETEKNFKYSQDLGWNWHKSWNIPNIRVRVEVNCWVKFMGMTPKNVRSMTLRPRKNFQFLKAYTYLCAIISLS